MLSSSPPRAGPGTHSNRNSRALHRYGSTPGTNSSRLTSRFRCGALSIGRTNHDICLATWYLVLTTRGRKRAGANGDKSPLQYDSLYATNGSAVQSEPRQVGAGSHGPAVVIASIPPHDMLSPRVLFTRHESRHFASLHIIDGQVDSPGQRKGESECGGPVGWVRDRGVQPCGGRRRFACPIRHGRAGVSTTWRLSTVGP